MLRVFGGGRLPKVLLSPAQILYIETTQKLRFFINGFSRALSQSII